MVAVLPTVEPQCPAGSVNRRLSALTSFCGFHARHGVELSGLLITMQPTGRRQNMATSYRPFLDHLSERVGERHRENDQKAPADLSIVVTSQAILAVSVSRDLV